MSGAALVTGAGRGIGAAIARRLASDGFSVAVNDVSAEAANSVVNEITESGGVARAAVSDVATVDGTREAVWQAEELAPLEVLVNNAGIVRDSMLPTMTEEHWDAVLQVNLKAPFLLTRAASAGMVERAYGRVVNITSRAWLGSIGQANYSASKGGLVSLTRATALELARKGVTVNCVAPGLIDTPLTQDLDDTVRERLLKAQPTRTMGSPDDVARAVSFFAAAENSFVTGQLLYVCGGKSVGGIF